MSIILVYCDFIYPQLYLAAGDPITLVFVTKSCKKFLVILKLCCSGHCRLRHELILFMTERETWTTPPLPHGDHALRSPYQQMTLPTV